MEKWIYDLEVFPNFFSGAFINETTKERKLFVVYDDVNDLKDLVLFVNDSKKYLIGYNNSKYDDVILNYLIAKQYSLRDSWEVTNAVYNLSVNIISSQRGGGSIFWNKDLKDYLYPKKYKSLDLMSVMAFDKKKVGLKQVSVNLKWHKIQDLPKPFDSQVEAHEAAMILDYGWNDVEITHRLFDEMLPEIRLRQSVGNQYNIKCMSASRSKIADLLMNKFYSEKSNLKYSQFKDLRDPDTTVEFKDIIWDKLSYETPVMQQVLEDLKRTTVSADKGNKDFKISIPLFDCMHEMAKGGLHSKMPAKIYEETEEYKLIDLDFGKKLPVLH